MDIKRSGSQPSGTGPSDWFTGTVRIDPLHDAPAPARVAMASVTFGPGARTAWHTPPLGQTLIVTFVDRVVRERFERSRDEPNGGVDPASAAVASAMLQTLAGRARTGRAREELAGIARAAVTVICGLSVPEAAPSDGARDASA